MPNLGKEALARIKAHARDMRERQSGGGSKWVALNGQKALVEPGGSVVIRLMPRWDFFDKRYTYDAKSQRLVERSDYEPDTAFVHAWEHWWQNGQKRQRDWCLQTSGGKDAPCPLCEVAAAYKAGTTPEDQEIGRRMAAKEVFLYNVVVRAHQYGEDGRPAIRILPVPGTLWLSINKNAAGETEGEESFSIGDYCDWREGYDWRIYRPAARKAGTKQEEYTAEHAKQVSPLYKPEEKERWRGWHKLLHNLEAEVQTKTYDELYVELHGVPPEGSEAQPSAAASYDQPPEDVGAPFDDTEAAPMGDDVPPDDADGVAGGADAGFDFPPEEPTRPAPAARVARPAPAAAPAPAGARKAPPVRAAAGRRR